MLSLPFRRLSRIVGLCHVVLFGLILTSHAQDDSASGDSVYVFHWPSVINVDSGQVTIYQPQIDSMSGTQLFSRAAVSYRKEDADPVFGVAVFVSQIEVDRDERTVDLVDVKVTQARFQGSDEDHTAQLDELIQGNRPDVSIILSLDELLTSLAATKKMREAEAALNNEPPQIIYEDSPALLVLINGDPVLTEIENSTVRAVINTPYPLLYTGSAYYLNVAQDVWYISQDIQGPWTFDPSPIEDVTKLVPPPSGEEQDAIGDPDPPSDEPITAANAPRIIVASEPTELLVTDGPVKLEPVVGKLRAVTNTESSLFYHGDQLLYFVVLSGRWYQAGDLSGSWNYVPASQLPSEFSRIPPESDYAGVRVHVAGTDEANEAVIDAQIPQTAAVERGQVDLEVSYDGDPKFEEIEGTDLEYAVNTGSQIIKSENRFYIVEEGVWYVSNDPDGPWEVSDHVPDGVQDIPPENPNYNVKYVYVYDTTPTVVYVGYTPGYTWTYVYGTTVVYGTGWWYHPWVTPYVYYPRYPTWGFHVHYNPWTGWSFGMSWSSGPFRFSFWSGGGWHYRHPWYRPPYWRRPYPRYYRRPPYNRYRSPSQRARVAHHSRPANRRAGGQPGARPSTRPATTPSTRPSTGNRGGQARPSTRDNNVYAGRDGNVYRRENNGSWSRNSSGNWGSQGSASTRDRSTTNQLNRQQHSRQRSTTRNNQYRSSGRSAGGGRAGGGRRR